MALRSPLYNVMDGAVRKAAKRLVRDFGEVEHLQVSVKGAADFVSTADINAERTLVQELSKARPGWGFLLEEGGEKKGDGHHVWVIDPLDGTTNFLHGIPHFAISVALLKDDDLLAGIVYNPVTDEEFWAEKGMGAWLNERRLRVSARKKLEESLFATGLPFKGKPDHDKTLSQVGRVMAVSAGVRRMGSASLDLAYVAAGRFDGFWEENIKPWDMAAGLLLVKEAGGTLTDMTGNHAMMERGDVIASNGQLHNDLRKLVG
ncbi:MAG: inositol monophosphatase [Alphaproteobacteria bacterium]|nr:inositol monophosphatase [Alphaproteobacteria bacterium]MBF0356252.1 inositol monophosphatase [Alphaproteobacteria bacterium]